MDIVGEPITVAELAVIIESVQNAMKNGATYEEAYSRIVNKELEIEMPEIEYRITLQGIEKILDDVARDVCPNCQLLIDWRNYYTEEDIKNKVEEIAR